MRILLQITFTTIKDLAGLVIMLAVIIYIFTVIGLKLLSEGYTFSSIGFEMTIQK